MIRYHFACYLNFCLCRIIEFLLGQRTQTEWPVIGRITGIRIMVSICYCMQMLFPLVFCKVSFGGFLCQDISIIVVGVPLL